jgi:hypothetical protein
MGMNNGKVLDAPARYKFPDLDLDLETPESVSEQCGTSTSFAALVSQFWADGRQTSARVGGPFLTA